MNFSDKVVLITGASSGIGAQTAQYFARLGAKLSLTERNLENLQKVAQNCALNGIKPLIVQGDLDNEDDIKNIVDVTINTYGQLDVLVNNAGILGHGSIENTTIDQYDRIFRTNVRAVYLLTSLSVPYLIKTKGNIINISSLTGKRAYDGALAYCMSKAALDHFTKRVALELAPKKVRVNSVNPGVIRTEVHIRAGMTREDYEKYLKEAENTHPLGRAGSPQEVAEAIVFLASEGASFITGEILSVDGGRHVAPDRSKR